MDHRTVMAIPITALKVVKHAELRRKRGHHRPSMAYSGESNPVKALGLAYQHLMAMAEIVFVPMKCVSMDARELIVGFPSGTDPQVARNQAAEACWLFKVTVRYEIAGTPVAVMLGPSPYSRRRPNIPPATRYNTIRHRKPFEGLKEIV